MSTLPKILVIVGPTASGKSNLAIKIAKYLNSEYKVIARPYILMGAEIVSADSRQIYRGMDIGTAKPPRDLARPNDKQIKTNGKRKFDKNSVSFDYYSSGIRHHLIDIKNPNEEYTVAQYKKDCLRVIRRILKRKKLPILVGGTGLYVKAVVENLEIPKVKPNSKLRKKLEKELKSKGVNYLYQKLIKLDPEAAYIVDPKNPRRIIRALEITIKTNKPFSKQRKSGKKLFDALKIGIDLPKAKLKKRIDKRVDEMMRLGLMHETKELIKRYPPKFETDSKNRIRGTFEKKYNPAFDAIGYREIIDYLSADKHRLKARINADNKIRVNPRSHQRESAALEEAVGLIKNNTWRYAKRQITWFKKDKEIEWMKNANDFFKLAKKRGTLLREPR